MQKDLKNFKPKNLLVRMPNWIGDVVMATPILSDLRAFYPKAKITAMCPSSVSSLLQFDPAINELFSFTRAESFFRRLAERNITQKLQNGKYDLGILLTNSFSSAWQLWQGKVKRILGFQGNCRTPFLNYPLPFPPKRKTQHLVLTYKALLEPLGIASSSTPPQLFVKKEERDKAWQFLQRFGISKENKLIGIHPGASYGPAKCWPPERFRKVAKKLIKRDPRYRILFFGDVGSKQLLGEICRGLPSVAINLAGLTNLRELMALIQICDGFLTNDSGPMHIADSLKTPLVALFGSTNPAVTGPFSQRKQVLWKKAPCAPCFKRSCLSNRACMKDIEVEEVFLRLLECLSQKEKSHGV